MKNTKRGRPTIYTPELAQEICDVIASSSKGIRRLCNENEHWPNPDTIYRWISGHQEFSERYARAKRLQIEVIVDEMLDIADDTSHDAKLNDEGKLIYDHEHIHRSRLRIDTRKWLAAKLAPKIYGEKISAVNTNLNVADDELALVKELTNEYLDDFTAH